MHLLPIAKGGTVAAATPQRVEKGIVIGAVLTWLRCSRIFRTHD
jgi:hypothetical protein